jgi:hypothetical protein
VIAAIGEDMTQPRESTSDQPEKCGCTVAILYAGFMHDACNQKARGVSKKVPFASLDLLARIVAAPLVWINVTANPTAEWIARQITEAFPWNEAPRYLIRDRAGSMAASSRADCAPWASGTSLPHRPRLGRMALWNG